MNKVIFDSWAENEDKWLASINEIAEKNEWDKKFPHAGNHQAAVNEITEQNEWDMEFPHAGIPQGADDDIIVAPRLIDVIDGRGSGHHYHRGNILLRARVWALLGRYSSLKRSGKTQLIRGLIRDLLSEGVRFLKNDKGSNGQWHIMDPSDKASHKVIHKKVSHCFRSAVKKAKSTAGPAYVAV